MNHGTMVRERVGRASVGWCAVCDRFSFDRMPNATEADLDDLGTAITRLRATVAGVRIGRSGRSARGHVGQ